MTRIDQSAALQLAQRGMEALDAAPFVAHAVASGGYVAGNAHRYSDIDVYCILRGDERPAEHTTVVDGIPVQLTYLSLDEHRSLCRIYDELRITADAREQLDAHGERGKLASRLLRGADLAGFEPLPRDALREDVFRHVAMSVQSAQVDRMLEDAAGALDFDEVDIADRASQLALDAAIDVVLLGVGDLDFGDALLLHRLARASALEPMRATLLELQSSSVARPGAGARRAVILERARAAARITSLATIYLWEDPDASAPLDRCLGTVAPGLLRCSPFHIAHRQRDSLGIMGLDKGYRVNEATARLWFELDGEPASDDEREAAFARSGVLSVVPAEREA